MRNTVWRIEKDFSFSFDNAVGPAYSTYSIGEDWLVPVFWTFDLGVKLFSQRQRNRSVSEQIPEPGTAFKLDDFVRVGTTFEFVLCHISVH